jgi:20S proteasome subunit beta 3
MSDPFSINGGSIVALVGKDCVGIACDLRLGQQAMTVSTDFPKIFPMGEKVFLGLSGLATDVQTLYDQSFNSSLITEMNCFDSRRICIV